MLAREIVLGNGKLLINIDKWLQIRDIFYPFVGQYNHLNGHAHKIAIFDNDKLTWLNDEVWKKKISYVQDTLQTHCTAINSVAQISIQFNDLVHHEENILIRKLTIHNTSSNNKHIRLCFHHDFHLYGDGIGDTALYHPDTDSVIHYKRSAYFLTGLSSEKSNSVLTDYTTGEKIVPSRRLARNPISQGNVDSIISTDVKLNPGEKKVIYYYLTAGENLDSVCKLQKIIFEKGFDELITETNSYQKKWLTNIKPDISVFPKKLQELYKQSLLIIKTQINSNGAIIAANDSDNMQFNKDTYSYMWPRDGALVAITLIKAGFSEVVKSFFTFCKDVLYKEGCLLHKYNPDKTLGSSWHPWVYQNKSSLPIQEDETALALFALWKYYEETEDEAFIKSLYQDFIKPAGDFLARYRYENGLPKESYDLWEERRGIFLFTVATTIVGLDAAEKLGSINKDKQFCLQCINNRDDIKTVLQKYFFHKNGYFRRSVTFENNEVTFDDALDSSVYALFEFELFDVTDPLVIQTMEKVKEWLSVKTPIGGFARYYKDMYQSKSEDFHAVPGNPWFICTLWYAKYLIKKSVTLAELKEALSILEWVEEHATSTKVLAEQLHPFTGEQVSVSPLTWSHAELIDTMTNYANKFAQLKK